MRWVSRKLRGNSVFARVDADGELVAGKDGRVEIAYRQGPGAKIYRASARNLEEGDSTEIVEFDVAAPVSSAPAGGDAEAAAAGDAIIIYTDGACSGNPGPMGIGAVVIDGGERQEISDFIGIGTNNIAELTAIKAALESIDEAARSRPVRVHTDSTYSIGILSKNWKAKANTELVGELRGLVKSFRALAFVKVKAHSGIPENERADQLAVEAITGR